jgi:tetratricopeptide (TPR) repeat protein
MLESMPLPRHTRLLPLAVMSWLLAGPAQADSFPSWYAKAQKAEAGRDDEAALQAWSNALRLWRPTDSKPKKAQALAARAAIYEKKGEWQAALGDLSGALKLKAKDAVLFHRRGVLCLEHGRTSEAISDFYKATALKLDYSETFFDRGRAYESQGDAEFSKEDFRTACHLGLQKACAKARLSKGKSSAHAAAPPPAVQARSLTASALPSAPDRQAAREENAVARRPEAVPPSIRAGDDDASTTVNALPHGRQDGDASASPSASPSGPPPAPPSAPPPDFRSCINRVRSCAENGDSYSTCVSRARLCEKYPKQGCCPRDCVVLFRKRLNSKSEAAAFREVFAPKSPCLSIEKLRSGGILEEAAP